MSPCYGFQNGLEQHRQVADDKQHESFKATDQFGGELRYFSDCILNDKVVEPDGEEGLADLVVIEAIVEALGSGGSVKIDRVDRQRRIDPDVQEQTLRAVSAPEPINASSPSRD
jgi:hypothetical protein